MDASAIFVGFFMGALVAQGVGLSLVLLRKSTPTPPAIYLLVGLLVALMTLGTQSLLLWYGEFDFIPLVLLVPLPVSLLLGPLLLEHTECVIDRAHPIDRNSAFNLLPAFFATLLLFWVGLDPARAHAYLKGTDPLSLRMWLGWFSILLFSGFTLVAHQRIEAAKGRMKTRPTEAQRLALSWLSYLLQVFWVTVILFVVCHTFDLFRHIEVAVLVVFSGATTAISYFALKLSRLLELASQDANPQPMPRYETSPLDSKALSKMQSELAACLKESRCYLDANLTLSELSARCKIPSHYITQVLSIEFGKNFYELLADYRIAHAKKLLADRDLGAKTVLEIAYDSGFNSKSVFNEAFRKRVGSTPSEFRRQA